MAISRFPRIPKSVKEFFEKSTQKVFTLEDLGHIFQEHITLWTLPVSTVEDFEKQLVQSNILQANRFEFEERIKSQIRFWTSAADIYDVAVSLIPRAHLSHITALFVHGIIEKQPKSIYITSEQSKKQNKTHTNELEQHNIDYAFSKPQRQTNTKCSFRKKEIIVLNGMHTDSAGLIKVSGKPITSLERTLIDVAVRPNYGGGVLEVLRAYIAGRERVDINVLINLLEAIDYTYPYYQCIGFYLEMAGYNSAQISNLKNREKFVDFYLDYEIKTPAYSKAWRLFYPKELDNFK